MSFMALAELVDKRADESRRRDEAILKSVQLHDTAIKLMQQRINQQDGKIEIIQEGNERRFTVIEARCKDHAQNSSSARADKLKALEESQTHWFRYVITMVVMIVVAVAGGVLGTAYAQRMQFGVTPVNDK